MKLPHPLGLVGHVIAKECPGDENREKPATTQEGSQVEEQQRRGHGEGREQADRHPHAINKEGDQNATDNSGHKPITKLAAQFRQERDESRYIQRQLVIDNRYHGDGQEDSHGIVNPRFHHQRLAKTVFELDIPLA